VGERLKHMVGGPKMSLGGSKDVAGGSKHIDGGQNMWLGHG
jgi:hypothetical protein